MNVNFGNQVELVGFSQPPCDQADCPVYLFWRALAPLQADYKLNATLFGRYSTDTWSQATDRRLAAYDYPTFRWPPGSIVLSQLPLNASIGTPPGEYRLRLGVYDDATGQALDVIDAAGAPQGRWAWLEPVTVNQLVVEGPGEGVPAGQPEIRMAPEILVPSLRVGASEFEAGDRIPVEVWWVVEQPPAIDYVLRAEWLDSAGQPGPGGGCYTFPFTQWPIGSPIRTQLDLGPSRDLSPGTWQLRLGLQSACTDEFEFAGQTVDSPIVVRPTNRKFEPSAPVQYPALTALGGVVELVGITVDNASERAAPVQPGATVPVTVTWRAIQPMDTSYTGFVHLLDANGQIVAQDDHVPLQNQYPTTQWVNGEVVEDRYELRLPADLPPGEYALEIGLYDANRPGLPRLKTSDGRDSVRLRLADRDSVSHGRHLLTYHAGSTSTLSDLLAARPAQPGRLCHHAGLVPAGPVCPRQPAA